MTYRIIYDSVNLRGVPRLGSKIIAYYLNGDYAVSSIAEVNDLFPGWQQVPIDVKGNRPDYARVFDVESGDISPGQLEGIITDYKRESPYYRDGGRPEIYCNRSTIPAVREGTGGYLLGRDYYLWVGTGDGTVYTGAELTGPYAKHGVNACQNIWTRTYNSSVILSDAWMPSR
jgi:hypothetical protein